MKTKITDGHTENGTRVEVWCDPENIGGLWTAKAYGIYTVLIDGSPVDVTYVSRLRDGGTTYLTLADHRAITYPRRICDPDRTPKLKGPDHGWTPIGKRVDEVEAR